MTRDQTFDAIANWAANAQAAACPDTGGEWTQFALFILACCAGFALVRYAKHRWPNA